MATASPPPAAAAAGAATGAAAGGVQPGFHSSPVIFLYSALSPSSVWTAAVTVALSALSCFSLRTAFPWSMIFWLRDPASPPIAEGGASSCGDFSAFLPFLLWAA